MMRDSTQISTLFPYTTLFRSGRRDRGLLARADPQDGDPAGGGDSRGMKKSRRVGGAAGLVPLLRLAHARSGDKGDTANIDRKSTRLNSSHRCISYSVLRLTKQ